MYLQTDHFSDDPWCMQSDMEYDFSIQYRAAIFYLYVLAVIKDKGGSH